MLARQSDGGVTLGGVLWGSHNLRARFARHVALQLGQETPGGKNRHRLLVGHANAESEAQTLARDILEIATTGSIEWSHVSPVGPALGAHGGSGTLIVGWQTQVDRQDQPNLAIEP